MSDARKPIERQGRPEGGPEKPGPIPEKAGSHDLIVMDRSVYTEMMARWSRTVRVLVVLVAVALGAVVFTQYQIRTTQKIGATRSIETSQDVSDIKRILTLVEGVASPEALAIQKQALVDALAAIRCDNRAALQDLLDQLIERGILAPGDATIACTGGPPVAGTTTTTPEGN